MNLIDRILCSGALLALLLSGCSAPSETPPPASPAPTAAALTPFLTPLPSPTSTALPPGTPTPLPSPTPTPRTHTVARGEDLGGLAFLYGVRLDDLIAANPNINPGAMSIGTVLVIPASASPAESTPAPALDLSITLDPVSCARTKENGAWCFVNARNTSSGDYENVSVVIRMAARDGSELVSQTALPLLNVLPAGDTFPLAAYFAPPVPRPFQTSVELLSALPRNSSDGRYIPARIENQTVQIAANGLSARVQGEIVLNSEGVTAKSIWVMAAASGANGVVGLRRWESNAELTSPQRLALDVTVYTTGEPILSVSTRLEARP